MASENDQRKLSKTGIGYLIGVISTLIWSSANIFVSYISKNHAVPPSILAMWRNILLCVVLVVIFLVISPDRFRLEKKHFLLFALYGLVIATDNSVANISVQYNGASIATVLLYGSVAFSALFGWLFYKEPMNPLKIAAIVVCLAGCVVVSDAFDPQARQQNRMGILMGILSGLTFSIYSIMGKETSERKIDPWTTMLYSYLFSLPFLLLNSIGLMVCKAPMAPDGIGCRSLLPGLNGSGWLAMLGLAIFPTIIGSGLYVVEMAYLPVNTANLIGTIEPFSTGLQAYLFLGERLRSYQLIGGLIIVAAVILSRIADSSQNT